MKENLVLIFDFDGTIAKTMLAAKKILDRLSLELNFRKIGNREIEELRGKKTEEIIKISGISLRKVPSAVKKARLLLADEISNLKPVKGMKGVLAQLKKEGCEIGILTSNSKENVEIFLDKNNLNLFDFIYSGSSIWGKSSVIKDLIKKRKLNSRNIVYIGDETRDIEASRRAEIKIIAVTWGFNNEEILKKQNPDYLAKQPKELVEILSNF